MKTIKYLSIAVIVFFVGAWITVSSLTQYVPIGKVGVRIQQYSLLGNKGVVTEDFRPGWHRNLGPIDNWVLFDSTVQSLEMTRDPKQGSRAGRDDVQVQSADGYAVSVDVTIKYRIMTDKAYALYQDTGSGERYKNIVRTEAQGACMNLFGLMKTEDFYDPVQRREKAIEVHKRLSESLGENFVEVIDVLIRDVQFDPEYEKKIRTKKLADQEVEVNKSLARSEQMSGKTQVIETESIRKTLIIAEQKKAKLVELKADADLEIATLTAEAQRYVTEKKADADLQAAQAEAEGTKLVKMAQAEGERIRNEAMRGVGGSIIVALEAAKNLNLTSITVSTVDIDFLDLDAMATRLGVPETTP